MMKEIKAKAKKAALKPKPSFEVLDVPEAERARGEYVQDYQSRKAEEAKTPM